MIHAESETRPAWFVVFELADECEEIEELFVDAWEYRSKAPRLEREAMESAVRKIPFSVPGFRPGKAPGRDGAYMLMLACLSKTRAATIMPIALRFWMKTRHNLRQGVEASLCALGIPLQPVDSSEKGFNRDWRPDEFEEIADKVSKGLPNEKPLFVKIMVCCLTGRAPVSDHADAETDGGSIDLDEWLELLRAVSPQSRIWGQIERFLDEARTILIQKLIAASVGNQLKRLQEKARSLWDVFQYSDPQELTADDFDARDTPTLESEIDGILEHLRTLELPYPKDYDSRMDVFRKQEAAGVQVKNHIARLRELRKTHQPHASARAVDDVRTPRDAPTAVRSDPSVAPDSATHASASEISAGRDGSIVRNDLPDQEIRDSDLLQTLDEANGEGGEQSNEFEKPQTSGLTEEVAAGNSEVPPNPRTLVNGPTGDADGLQCHNESRASATETKALSEINTNWGPRNNAAVLPKNREESHANDHAPSIVTTVTESRTANISPSKDLALNGVDRPSLGSPAGETEDINNGSRSPIRAHCVVVPGSDIEPTDQPVTQPIGTNVLTAKTEDGIHAAEPQASGPEAFNGGSLKLPDHPLAEMAGRTVCADPEPISEGRETPNLLSHHVLQEQRIAACETLVRQLSTNDSLGAYWTLWGMERLRLAPPVDPNLFLLTIAAGGIPDMNDQLKGALQMRIAATAEPRNPIEVALRFIVGIQPSLFGLISDASRWLAPCCERFYMAVDGLVELISRNGPIPSSLLLFLRDYGQYRSRVEECKKNFDKWINELHTHFTERGQMYGIAQDLAQTMPQFIKTMCAESGDYGGAFKTLAGDGRWTVEQMKTAAGAAAQHIQPHLDIGTFREYEYSFRDEDGRRLGRLEGNHLNSVFTRIGFGMAIAQGWINEVTEFAATAERHERETLYSLRDAASWFDSLGTARDLFNHVKDDIRENIQEQVGSQINGKGNDISAVVIEESRTAEAWALHLTRSIETAVSCITFDGDQAPASSIPLRWWLDGAQTLDEVADRRLFWMPRDRDAAKSKISPAVAITGIPLMDECRTRHGIFAAARSWIEKDYPEPVERLQLLLPEAEQTEIRERLAEWQRNLADRYQREAGRVRRKLLAAMVEDRLSIASHNEREPELSEAVAEVAATHGDPKAIDDLKALINMLDEELDRELYDSEVDLWVRKESLKERLASEGVDTSVCDALIFEIERLVDNRHFAAASTLLSESESILDRRERPDEKLKIALAACISDVKPLIGSFLRRMSNLTRWLRQNEPNWEQRLILGLTRRAPDPLLEIPASQYDEVRPAFENWADLRLALTHNTEVSKYLPGVFRFLGFSANLDRVGARAIPGESPAPGIRTATMYASAGRKPPLPHFGSYTAGKYLLVICQPDAKTFDIGIAMERLAADERTLVVVLYCAVLSAAKRDEIAVMARERRWAIAVVDDLLMLHLASFSESERLSVFVHCTAAYSGINPYTATVDGDVSEEIFVERGKLVQKVGSMDGPRVIYGGRQLGKSALLKAAYRKFNRYPDYIVLYCDLNYLSSADLWKTLDDQLRRAGLIEEDYASSNAITVANRIRVGLKHQEQKKLLILLDEADSFLNDEPRVNYINVRTLLDLMQPHERSGACKIVFAGNYHILRFRIDNHATEDLGNPIVIGPLSYAESVALIQQPMAAIGYGFEKDGDGTTSPAVQRILQFTMGYAGMIQLLLSRVVQHMRRRENAPIPAVITTTDIDETIATTFESEAGSVQRELRERFALTVRRDFEYGVIFFCMLDAQRGNSSTPSFFTDRKVLELVEKRWSQGVDILRRELKFDLDFWIETRLEEMSGLGLVIRRKSSTANGSDVESRVRSQELVRLFGEGKEIQEQLKRYTKNLPQKEGILEHVHPPLRTRQAEANPFPMIEIRRLNAEKVRTRLIFCSKACGADLVPIALDEFLSSHSPSSTLVQLSQDIAGSAITAAIDQWRATSEAHSSGCLVQWPSVSALSSLDEAIDVSLRYLALKNRAFTVNFLLDAARAYAYLSRRPLGAPPPSISIDQKNFVIGRLAPWRTLEIACRLGMIGRSVTPHECEPVLHVTGGWPRLLDTFFSDLQRQESLEVAAQRFESRLFDANPALRNDFLNALGLPEEPTLMQVMASVATVGEDFSASFRENFAQIGISVQQFDAAIETLWLMGCLERKDRGEYEVLASDPLVRRIFSAGYQLASDSRGLTTGPENR